MVLTISVAIIAASVILFVAFLIPVLLQIRRTSRELEKLFDTARMQVTPLSHDLTALSLEIKGILQSVRRQVDKAEDGITAVRDAALRLKVFQAELEQTIEGPLLELASLVKAVSRGIETFLRIIRR
jgi:uncharacterized protein YoxC